MHQGLKAGWRLTCDHEAAPVPAIVLDPFAGSGTTGLVARALGRSFIGLDLSFTYLSTIAASRLALSDLAAWQNGQAKDAHQVENPYNELPLFSGGEVL